MSWTWGWATRMARHRSRGEKLIEAAKNPRNHRYSMSRAFPNCGWKWSSITAAVMAWNWTRRPKRSLLSARKTRSRICCFAVIGPDDAVVSPNPAYPIHQYGVIMAEGHA